MLSIIYVNYKTSSDIKRSLASIKQYEQNYKKYEYIVVDNNSGDPDFELIKKKFPFVNLIQAEENGGFSYGNNIGIRQAKGDTIFLLNPDTYIFDNSIEKLYTRLKNDPDLKAVGPKLLFEDRSNQTYYLPKSYPTLWRMFTEYFYLYRIFKNSDFFNSYFRTEMDYSKESYVEQISGAALMFKKDALNKVGYMDENYFMFFEESDFCYQFAKNNYKMLYYPESEIVHIGGFVNPASWPRSVRDSVYSYKYYFKKNFGSFYKFIAVLTLVSSSFLKTILCALTFKKKTKFFWLMFKNAISISYPSNFKK